MKLIAVGKSGQLTLAGAHIHDMWEIILNLEGSGIMTVGSEDFSFGEGDVVCVPPKVAHTKKADTFFSCVRHCLYFVFQDFFPPDLPL